MKRRIYLLNPRQLSPETIAVTFARTSRSPQNFDEIAAELTDEKSAQFHEKWVVGYGHASVAEHAVLHIAVENISRLAVEALESSRLASYTEKSTRYQKWAPGSYVIPAEFAEEPLRSIYTAACDDLFSAYQQALPMVKKAIEAQNPCQDGETEAAWDRRIRSRYVDVCRFLLPAASLANVGMTANARVLEYAITKMLSHPIAEVRQVGVELKTVTQAEVPTLVKYAAENEYLRSLAGDAQPAAVSQVDRPPDWCQLVHFDPQGEDHVLAAYLFRTGGSDYTSALEAVKRFSLIEKQDLAARLLAARGGHDMPPRELEEASYTFDFLIDQGGYFELKRHRMMTQISQLLTCREGWVLPRLFADAGASDLYQRSMQIAQTAYNRLAEEYPFAASYVVPNGYLRRVLLTFNLRTAFHLCALRSAENAHFSMRRAALRIAEEIRKVHPVLGAYLQTTGSSWREIEASHFLS